MFARLAVVFVVASCSYAASPVSGAPVTMNFNSLANATARGWAGVGNTSGGHSFGFSNTDFTGLASPAGEAGGTFRRSSAAYYADLTLGGTFTDGTAFSASGELDVSAIGSGHDNNVFLGHFDPLDSSMGTNNMVGIEILESQGSGLRFAPRIYFASGGDLIGTPLVIGAFPNSDRTWSYAWNPNGGVDSNGRLTISISGAGSSFVDVLSGDTRVFGLTAFGMGTRGTADAGPTNTIDWFIDGLTYSSFFAAPPEPVAVIPEPSTFVLLALGAVGLIARRRWNRK